MLDRDKAAPGCIHAIWRLCPARAKKQIAVTVLLVACGAALSSLGPVFLKGVIDAVGREGFGGSASLLFPVTPYLLSLFAYRSLNDIRWVVYGNAEQELKKSMGVRFFTSVMSMSRIEYVERNGAELTGINNTAFNGARMMMLSIVLVILPILIEFGVMVAAILAFGDYIIVLIVVAYLVVYFWSHLAVLGRLLTLNKAANERSQEATRLLGDAFANVENIHYFNALSYVCGKYEATLEKAQDMLRDFSYLRAGSSLLQGGAFSVMVGSVVIYAAVGVRSGQFAVSHFVMLVTYVVQVCRPLDTFSMAVRDVQRSAVLLEPYFKIAATHDALSEGSGRMPEETGILFNDVEYSYRPDVPVLKSVSFSIPQGTISAIVGPTGGGKTTIARLILGICTPTRGSISIGGAPIEPMQPQVLRKAVSIVPQDIVLFHDTLRNNIALGLENCGLDDIREAASKACIDDFIMSLPERYDTLVGNRGMKLSGGERQRIAIARALVRKPKAIIFDEGTSALDAATEEKLLSDLVEATRGTTLLLIAHRPSTIRRAQHVIVLNAGKAVEQGTPDSLLQQDGWFQRAMIIGQIDRQSLRAL